MAATPPPLPGRLLAESLGAALLAALVIASGIAAQKLSPNDVALRLLEDAAIGPGLFAIILVFRAVSGVRPHPTYLSRPDPSAVPLARGAMSSVARKGGNRVLAGRPQPGQGT